MADFSVTLRPSCWCLSAWAPTWRLHTNLYKFGWNTFPNNAPMNYRTDLNLGEVVYLSIIFHIPVFLINSLNGYDFYFWWRDTENQPLGTKYFCRETKLVFRDNNESLLGAKHSFRGTKLVFRDNNREFKQITTAGATTAAMTEKVWGEYVSVVCQILSLASKAKYKDERNIG